MKKIVIFGATGNVGSYVLKYAREYFNTEEYEVIASGRRKTDFFEKRGIPYYSVDLTKAEDFDVLPQEDVYAVIYLAAEIPSYMDDYQPDKYIKSNIIGAYNVLEYCRKTKADRILFSTTVFDISLSATNGAVLKPDMPHNFSYKGDHAVYVISKNTAIELIEHYHQEYGLKKFIFRFPTIYNYSPYHYYYPNGVKTLRPVYRMIEQAKKGEPIELWGNPEYSKDMVHVYDCAQMICKAVEVDREEGFYNVGTGKPVTLKEQIETIIKVFSPKDHPSEIIYCPEKPAGGGFLMDVQNAKEELGYEPQYDCLKLFEDYKKEMEINRFEELRRK
ncbi:NAD(P)-dependent oxidoreductase [Faecalibacillus intestinalis]|uniref:NAD-dependent epimerase/dehydratase family protein n=1 Tax=Faecalibacillus intestinalis TaxID=1982626 RepID=UPI002E772243|nr:NAD(P)-dependent oxidoreductase [Faecalibacillus intestinalis]MEE1446901.1 NAD(P)-dependent oxidoreductase [Faecalibacillus intestinalis]